MSQKANDDGMGCAIWLIAIFGACTVGLFFGIGWGFAVFTLAVIVLAVAAVL